MAQHIKTILDTVIKSKDDWKLMLLAQWPTIIGDLKADVSIEKIKSSSIVLGVSDSCLLQELYLLSPLILSLINKTLDCQKIKQIHFKQVYRKKRQRTKEVQNNNSTTAKSITLTHQEKTALKKITDKTLRKELYKLRFQCQ